MQQVDSEVDTPLVEMEIYVETNLGICLHDQMGEIYGVRLSFKNQKKESNFWKKKNKLIILKKKGKKLGF